jgi:penicillin-binding protein 1C
MRQVSGVEGAGYIWRRIMNRVTQQRSPRPTPPPDLVQVRICHRSGMLLGPHCEGGRDEWFVPGTEPASTCSFHREVRLDPENDLLVPAECYLPGARVARVTVYPSPFDHWATEHEAGRAERYTPRCPRPASPATEVTLLSPAPTEAVRIDTDLVRAHQALTLQVALRHGSGPVTFFVDGSPIATVDAPHVAFWPVTPGAHTVHARHLPSGNESAPARVRVY